MSNNSLSPRSHLDPHQRHTYDKIFVFCHGFGFDKHYWDNLADYFKGYECHYWDMGYFDKNVHPMPHNHHAKIIGVGHSLGFIKLLKRQSEFHALVGVQGFTDFTGSEKKLYSKRQKTLEEMKKSFQENPKRVMEEFYQNCEADYMSEKMDSMKTVVLEEDLHQLEKTFTVPKCPTLIIGSENDKIVPPAIIKDNFSSHANVKIVMHATGGHNLGYTEAKFVSDTISSFAKDI